MQKLNIGIIGCGRIADLHYLGYQYTEGARIFAVCDSNPEVAEARKREWNAVKSYTDFREMLRAPEVDAVEILTPHHLHETMVVEAAKAKKHIAVQKPMSISLPSADRMLAETQKAGVVYKVTENYVFYPPLVLAKKMIENGDIGEPIGIRMKFIGGASGGWKVPAAAWEWRMKETAEGRGIDTFDHGHHLWSTAWFLLGEVERVSGWIDSADGVVDCPAVMMWKYKGGKRYGVCDFAHAGDMPIPSQYYANDEWLEITGNRGIIFIHRCTGNIHEGPVMSVFDGKSMRHISDVKSDWSEGFIGATRNFIEAIHGRQAPLLTGEQGREILRFALAIQKAARIRREVYLDELDRCFPSFYAWRRKRRELKASGFSRRKFPFGGLGENLSRYAPQAKFLTEQLMVRFDPSAALDWETVVGLHLTADGTAKEEKLGLYITGGKAALRTGELPENAKFTLRIPAGTWAAILLGKKRIEVALFQGKLKFEGKAEEGLKLRAAFKL